MGRATGTWTYDSVVEETSSSLTIPRGLSLPPIPSPLPPSPSTQAADPPSRVQTADHSQESTFSSQPPSAEHFLRDLITPTEATSDALSDALRRLKRPHDGEAEDEPLAKRDLNVASNESTNRAPFEDLIAAVRSIPLPILTELLCSPLSTAA